MLVPNIMVVLRKNENELLDRIKINVQWRYLENQNKKLDLGGSKGAFYGYDNGLAPKSI